MKKFNPTQFVAGTLLLLTSFNLHAQESHIAVLLNMVNSKLNYGTLNKSLNDYRKDVRGLQAGLSWQASVSNRFSVVSEAYFIRKGGRLQSGNPLTDVGSTLKLYSVEVPVLARVHAGRWYFNAGPYTNYILSGKSITPEATRKISFAENGNGYKRWEAGVQAGAGFQFRIKRARMAVDVRYSHGLSSISRYTDIYNRTLNVSIVAFKPLKK
ncbi:MAG: porin family protein [Cyclobacteriaceae bacterium]